MTHFKFYIFVFVFLAMMNINGFAASFDVVHYDAQIEPDIINKTVSGTVKISFEALADNLRTVEFDCGELVIDAVRENDKTQKFEKQKNRLTVILSRPAKAGERRELEIKYHGAPRYGIRFFPDLMQVYTVFSTSQWMVCVDTPDERATFRLNLILPAGLKAVGNGRLRKEQNLANQKTSFEWEQKTPVPSYVYGFAAGRFRELNEQKGKLKLRYLSSSFTDAEMKRIFGDTPDMMNFYEQKAGVPYADSVYTQVLAAGGAQQEMSSFTAMNEDYGREVLKDKREIWLAAHEAAHQWWGNMVTCRDWRHFWLNEGTANFMVAAYKEYRFGREEYLKEVADLREKYEKVKAAGKDKPLVFPDWNKPTREDRSIVYNKGGYVLHLLREEMGDQAFWQGFRAYTQKYWGKSVTTADFQKAMAESSNKDLSKFFAKWVYAAAATD